MNVFEQNPTQQLTREVEDWETNEVAAFLRKQIASSIERCHARYAPERTLVPAIGAR